MPQPLVTSGGCGDIELFRAYSGVPHNVDNDGLRKEAKGPTRIRKFEALQPRDDADSARQEQYHVSEAGALKSFGPLLVWHGGPELPRCAILCARPRGAPSWLRPN